MIKISDTVAVNPEHVASVILNKEKLQTLVLLNNGVSLASGKAFQETVDLFNQKEMK